MPLTRKGSEILEAMRKQYGPKEAPHVFYASINSGRITGAEAGGPHQTHHRPVTNSPFHSLRPPAPEGANKDGRYDFIPAGRREVMNHPSGILDKDMPHHMEVAAGAQHQHLAHEVASGLRKFSFAQVRRQQPAQL